MLSTYLAQGASEVEQRWRGKTKLGAYVAITAFTGLLLAASPSAHALSYNFPVHDLRITWNNRVVVGAQMRTEKRDSDLVDKSNVPGQYLLCSGLPGSGLTKNFNPDCQSRIGDPAPSRRLINAEGGYNINGDDGNLNYDQGDLTYLSLILRSEFSMYWKNWTLKVSGIGWSDPINSDFQNSKPNLMYPNRGLAHNSIAITREQFRHDDVEDAIGNNARFLEAWVGYKLPLDSVPIEVRVGRQRLRWGQSNMVNFNVLDRVNPLSGQMYSMPGIEVRDAFLPVDMVTLKFDFTNNISTQLFYQYNWERTRPVSCGSFLSYTDVAACGDGPTPVYLSQGQYPEDPYGQFVPGGADVLLDQGIRTAYLEPREMGYPEDGGQYGLRFNYFADWLNGGTSFSFYGMNIHSRLPYLSVIAADETCLNTSGAVGTSMITDLSSVCGNSATPLADTFPVSTVRPFLEYPEDIHIFGMSFTTNMGRWSLAGELTYSPNQPAQVSYADVLFAGLQPAFPDTPAGVSEGDLLNGENALLIPTDRIAVPDYLETRYRNHDVQAGDMIHGFTRLKVGQIDLTAIRVLSSSNPIKADQIIIAVEAAAQKIFDMPSLDELQLEGGSAHVLHYSEGAAAYNPKSFTQGGDDGAAPGSPAASQCPVPSSGCRPIGPTDRINPEKADPDDFADDFSAGYRLRVSAAYYNAIGNVDVTPLVEFFHDVYGTSISPGQNFVEGRMRLTVGSTFQITDHMSATVNYRFYMGAGYRNVRLDRDYVEAYMAYTF